MRKYHGLPEMAGENDDGAAMEMHCGGCGCKVGSDVLDAALQRLKATEDGTDLSGLEHPDDAAVVAIPEGTHAV